MRGDSPKTVEIDEGSDDLIVKLGCSGDGNAHRPRSPDKVAGSEKAKQAVCRLLGQTVCGQKGKSGDGVTSLLKQVLTSVL